MLKIDNSLVKRLRNLPLDEDFENLDLLRGVYSRKLISRREKYLDSIELEQILCWKLDTQAHRSKQLRLANTDGLVIPLTRAYFNLKSENFDYETEVKIKLLTSLKGVGVPLATSVMAITEPQKYCIVDSVLWEFIFNEEKSSFTVNDYLRFHKIICELSEKLAYDVQKTEFTLWKLSMASK